MIKKIYAKYFVRLLIFSIIIEILSIFFQKAVPQYVTPAMPYIVLFYFLMNAIVHYIVLRGSAVNDKRFINNYILGTMIKFFSILIFVGIYIFLHREDAVRFAVTFFVFYFVYAIFEVIAVKKDAKSVRKWD